MIRTRSPLSPGRSPVLARLACMRRAASVRPEPGSNSPSRPRGSPESAGFPSIGELPSEVTDLVGQLCAAPNRPLQPARVRHGIDMWVLPSIGTKSITTGNSARTGFRLSLLCFQETALRPPPKRRRITDTRPRNRWSEALRARRARASQKRYKNVGVNRLRSSGPVRTGAIRRAGRGARLASLPR